MLFQEVELIKMNVSSFVLAWQHVVCPQLSPSQWLWQWLQLMAI